MRRILLVPILCCALLAGLAGLCVLRRRGRFSHKSAI